MQIFLQNWKEHVMMIYIVISSYILSAKSSALEDVLKF